MPKSQEKKKRVCIGPGSNTGVQYGNPALPLARAGQHLNWHGLGAPFLTLAHQFPRPGSIWRARFLPGAPNRSCPALGAGRAAFFIPGSTIRTHNAPWRTKLSRPALGAGRAASGAPTSCQTRTRTRQNHNTPHQLAHGRTKSMHQASFFCPALHKGRAASWE